MAVNDGNRDDNLERQPQLARLVEALGGEEPPPALDAAILAAARLEVSARPQVVGGGGEATTPTPAPRQKRNRYVPLSIAAVLVMSVSLVTLVHQEKGDELTQPPRVTKESAPAAVAVPPAAEPKRTAVGTAASEASVTAARREAPGSQGERAPAAARQEVDAAGQVARDRQRDASGRLDRAGAGSAPNPGAVASPPAPSPPARESKVLAEPFPAAVTRESAQPRVPAAPPPAAESRIAAAPPAPASVAKPAQQRSGPQQMTRPAWFTELENQPPEKWLERLAQFKRDGRQAEADELMSEFRRRFPDHPAGAR